MIPEFDSDEAWLNTLHEIIQTSVFTMEDAKYLVECAKEALGEEEE
jgi:hypothetical protein